MAIKSEGHLFTRQLFMRLMACVYLCAFSSLYTQVPGLYGPRGLSPVHNIIPEVQSNVSWLTQVQSFPSLLLFHSSLHLSPSLTMELCCLVGVALSLLMMVCRAVRCTIMFGVLWILYLSVYQVGHVFLWFQWDSLLLEAGFLTILVAPFNLFYWSKSSTSISSTDGLCFWLLRFLLFRLMFASGIVKLTSMCPTWWGLTALNYHYETQCIPTPLAWYAHQLPEWMQKLSVVCTYVIEIAIPLLFFMPMRSLRILGFLSQVLLQILIIATGNYNFFNLLTITLSFSLVDDRFLGYASSSRRPGFLGKTLRMIFGRSCSMMSSAIKTLSFISITGLLVAVTIYYFNLSLDLDNMAIQSRIMFSNEGFAKSLAVVVPLVAVIASISLIIELANSVLEAILVPGVFYKIYSLLQTATLGSIVVALFSVSLVSHGVLDNNFSKTIPPYVATLHQNLNRFSLTSSYGLFRKMTGVGGRPEVIIEGTNGNPEIDADWREYEFLYKPGNVGVAPAFVAPHQPRLDWQMWFAALGHYNHNPWLVNLAYKLLIGEKDVLQLMAPPPFPSPPKYIRARLYSYHFTQYNSNRILSDQPKAWWRREFDNDYLYALTKDNVKLLEFLESKNYLHEPDMSSFDSSLVPLLSYLREASTELSPPLLIWSLLFSGMVLSFTVSLLHCNKRGKAQAASKVDITDYLSAMETSDDQQLTSSTIPKAKHGPYRRHKN